MPQTVTRSLLWTGAWGGYLNLTVSFDLTAVINDDVTEMACTITNLNQYFSWGEVEGYGFVNVGGIMWAVPSFSMRFDDSGEVPETWDDTLPELTQACPQIPDEVVYGLYASDDGSPPRVSGQFGQATTGQAVTHTFALSGQPSGEMNIITPFERWRDNGAAQAVVDSQGGFTVTWRDLVDYFPGARRLTGAWASCNREGGGSFRREASAWADVKNGGSSAMGRRRVGGSWAAIPEKPQ